MPSDEQPTAKQTSVTLRSPRRSSAIARSMRRVVRDAVSRLAVGAPELAAEVPGRHVRAAGERLDVQRLRVLPVDPVTNAAQPREVAQVLRCGRSARHLGDRATSHQSCLAPLTKNVLDGCKRGLLLYLVATGPASVGVVPTLHGDVLPVVKPTTQTELQDTRGVDLLGLHAGLVRPVFKYRPAHHPSPPDEEGQGCL